ncbi:MAG: hypothetical protein REI78_01065 [Pedobacter sp.]|nr:hypothetical protein [Pedobacter sp.]MDQ8051578.1 hypothetical protein [Pedobacter sp.]
MEFEQEMGGTSLPITENSTTHAPQSGAIDERIQQLHQLLRQEFNEPSSEFPLWGIWK